jgi:protein-S-isoprenylcysteine O-methyltransferase Ste14
MKDQPLTSLVVLAQIVGVVFFGIFLAAFYLPMPSNDTLIGDTNFRTPMSIFGIIFIAITVIALLVSYAMKRKD